MFPISRAINPSQLTIPLCQFSCPVQAQCLCLPNTALSVFLSSPGIVSLSAQYCSVSFPVQSRHSVSVCPILLCQFSCPVQAQCLCLPSTALSVFLSSPGTVSLSAQYCSVSFPVQSRHSVSVCPVLLCQFSCPVQAQCLCLPNTALSVFLSSPGTVSLSAQYCSVSFPVQSRHSVSVCPVLLCQFSCPVQAQCLCLPSTALSVFLSSPGTVSLSAQYCSVSFPVQSRHSVSVCPVLLCQFSCPVQGQCLCLPNTALSVFLSSPGTVSLSAQYCSVSFPVQSRHSVSSLCPHHSKAEVCRQALGLYRRKEKVGWLLGCLVNVPACSGIVSRVSDQNDLSQLYIFVEKYHSV